MEVFIPVSDFCAEHRLVANTTAHLRCKHLNKWSKYLTEKGGFQKLGFPSWERLSTHHVRVDNEVTKRLYSDRRIERGRKQGDGGKVLIRRTYPDTHLHLSRRYLSFAPRKTHLSQDVTENVIAHVVYNGELHKWTPEMVVLFESPPPGAGARRFKRKREVVTREPRWFIWSEEMCQQLKLLCLLCLNFEDLKEKAYMSTHHGETSYEAKALRYIRGVVKLREKAQGEKDYERVQRMQKLQETTDAVPSTDESCTNKTESKVSPSKDIPKAEEIRTEQLEPEGEDDAVDDFAQPPRKRRCREGVHREQIILFPYTTILPNEEDAADWRYVWSFFHKAQTYFDRVASFIAAEEIEESPPLLEPTTCTCAWESYTQRAAKIDPTGRVMDQHFKKDPHDDGEPLSRTCAQKDDQSYAEKDTASQSPATQTDEHAAAEAQSAQHAVETPKGDDTVSAKPAHARKSALISVSATTKVLRPYTLWTSEEADALLGPDLDSLEQAKRVLDWSDADIGDLLRYSVKLDGEESSEDEESDPTSEGTSG